VWEAPREADTRQGKRIGIAGESFGNHDILGCVWEPGFWDQLGTLAFWDFMGMMLGPFWDFLGPVWGNLLGRFWGLFGAIFWGPFGTQVLGTYMGTTSWDMFGRLHAWEHFGALFWEQVGKIAFLGRFLGAPGAVWEGFGSQSFPLVDLQRNLSQTLPNRFAKHGCWEAPGNFYGRGWELLGRGWDLTFWEILKKNDSFGIMLGACLGTSRRIISNLMAFWHIEFPKKWLFGEVPESGCLGAAWELQKQCDW
jgi:hypothetical protein